MEQDGSFKWTAYLLTAVYFMIQAFRGGHAPTALIMLVILLIVLCANKTKTLGPNLPVFAAAYLALSAAVTCDFALQGFTDGLGEIVYGIISAEGIEFFIIPLIAFIIIWKAAGKGRNVIIRCAGYLCAALFWGYAFERGTQFTAYFIYVLTAAFAAADTAEVVHKSNPKIMRNMSWIFAVFFFISTAFVNGATVTYEILMFERSWGASMAAACIFGTFIALEANSASYISSFYEKQYVVTSFSLWTFALFALCVGLGANAFMSFPVLYVGIPIAGIVWYILSNAADKNQGKNIKAWYLNRGFRRSGYWVIVFASLLAAGRTANNNPQIFFIFAMILIVRYGVVAASYEQYKKTAGQVFLGIFAAVMAFVAGSGLSGAVSASAGTSSLALLIAVSILWTAETVIFGMMRRGATVAESYYENILNLHMAAPMILAAASLAVIIFR